MSDAPIDLDTKRIGRPSPFRVRSLSEFNIDNVPRRDWLIPSVVLKRSITLFAGDGGVGKSLMCQQLQVAAALGIDWLGLPIPEPITSFGYYCEDDEDELHRRFADICKHYGCTFNDVEERVLFACRVGERENELIRFSGKSEFGKPTRTETYAQVATIVKEYEVQLTILDTISDIFAGNENIRYQVKTFVTMIRGLALINNGGIILTSHPSKTAMVDGSGFSGSTAWNGAVRNRLYLTAGRRSKDEDGDDAPTDDRMLRIMKSNYGPFGQKIRCQWSHGAFVIPSSSRSIVDRLDAKAKLLGAARKLVSDGAMLALDANGRTSLVVRAREMLPDYPWNILKGAQDALVEDGALVKVQIGTKSRARWYVRPSEARYLGEEDSLL